MPRIARLVVPGAPHHIVQRGTRGYNVFRHESDRAFYLDLMAKSCSMYRLAVRAYCLMPNHVHYIAVPQHLDSISRTFHRAHGSYGNWFNKKYELAGHLWQERPFSCVLSDSHLRNAIRYVENNPVRAGFVPVAAEFRWSSAFAHCRAAADPLLDPDEPLAVTGWEEWLDGGADPEFDKRIRECTFAGWPCGDEAFVREIEKQTGRSFVRKKRGPKPKASGHETPLLDFDDG